MSIQPQFESYRYVGEICRLKGQSLVECRLPGSEINGILAVYVKAVPADCACVDGEVQYGGKAFICIVYEDGEKRVCRAERGVEFFHKAEGKAVTPACFAKAGYAAENVSWRREGSGLYISALIGAEITVFGGKQMEYLAGGEGLICQTQPITLCKSVCASGEVEGEDEFDADYVGDVLMHGQTAVIHYAAAREGQIELEGELALHICVLKGENDVCSYERILPFRMQVPCDEAYGENTVYARACVKSAHLTAATDEEKGKSRMVLSYSIAADCFLHQKEELSVVADAFCVEAPLTLSKSNEGGRYLLRSVRCVERVSGTASLSSIVDENYTLQAAVLPKAEFSCRKGERGAEIEGAILAEVIFKGTDGGYRTATLSLPFLFPADIDGEHIEAEGLVCGLNIRRKKSGEMEAEATLKACVRAYEEKEWEYLSNVEEGEAYGEETGAFSVYLTGEGEELWTLAKRLHCDPEALQRDNPELEFPLKKKERIFVYRQIC